MRSFLSEALLRLRGLSWELLWLRYSLLRPPRYDDCLLRKSDFKRVNLSSSFYSRLVGAGCCACAYAGIRGRFGTWAMVRIPVRWDDARVRVARNK